MYEKLLEFRFACVQAWGLLGNDRISYKTRHEWEFGFVGVGFAKTSSYSYFENWKLYKWRETLPKRRFVKCSTRTAQWISITTTTSKTNERIITRIVAPPTMSRRCIMKPPSWWRPFYWLCLVATGEFMLLQCFGYTSYMIRKCQSFFNARLVRSILFSNKADEEEWWMPRIVMSLQYTLYYYYFYCHPIAIPTMIIYSRPSCVCL